MIMKYFTFVEFTRSENAIKLGYNNDPILNNESDALCHIELLVAKLLDPIREFIGEPVVITSGYRSEQVNKAVGGVHNSQHRKGQAADFIIPSIEAPLLTDLFWEISDRFDFDQLIYYNKQGFMHISYVCKLLNRNETFVR